MRVLRWVAWAAVAAWVGLFVAWMIQGRELPIPFVAAPYVAFGVLFVVAVVRNVLRPRRGGAARATLGPVVRGFDDVQDIYFGRTPSITPRYGSDEPDVASLVEPHPDPLDDVHWTLPGGPGGVR
ncbi:MAG: hypothetical protein BGO38_15680 [Cellulomonas sp. 73-145]|uniref:hypothetical protein n=1 Tax=Cellulomonas sp. 73-145 TaxID=1895739 RepID=UPI0009281D5F|nr:hypothetical protein [Cellulomonas sp. 73-145]MBN9326883.1 hypothetical protein [Cellulomonas sp.]OJV58800.1 MAG: hypothetical protein BGO38_15680 [Cellulomonas sp. 73-145]